MSISEFRKKKLLYVFNVFFDVNQSGEIDRKDFEMAVEKICELRGWPVGNSRNTETHESMFKIWEGLRAKADKDNDGQVSVEEWCKMWDEYMNFMFDLEDASNDGGIDAEEFSIVCSSYGLDQQECRDAFGKMAQGSEEVDREQFSKLWREYFSSDDPASPGNFIFGKTSF
ncbi:conserved hypothetical protein [Culex quinquefasciatus]|uniref:EF-hand domain-containing protein n=1 Tax=Culex quinquefasciatus TaxID=7176 RepID=B0WFE0_CULQU|nr:conserved hypothetical protein [Culex quinquefasciatus]|eukprot:XP_001847424.1 conserved hypothetical protein [Culex quinquefasciatus]